MLQTTGQTEASRSMSHFADSIYRQKYAWPGETWPDTSKRVAESVLGAVGFKASSDETLAARKLIEERKFLPGGRYLYACGRPLHQVQNCLLLRAEDSREGWSELLYKSSMALMTGAGIGVDYSEVRPSGSVISRTGGFATGPIALMKMINECGRGIMQGGSRRSAIWAGLSWKHDDVFDFIGSKNWSEEVRALKAKDFDFPAPMDMTNVSVVLDDEFFEAYENPRHPLYGRALDVYWRTVERMARTAEPGFSVDVGVNRGESLRNACTELTSSDDSDICNIGSINLARISTVEEMAYVVEVATLFLLAGTVYSDLPYDKVAEVREKNRRLGLGLMGVHEWLLQRGKPYGPDADLGEFLGVYARSTAIAHRWADTFGISRPVKTRAVAPTGTIGIVAETTTGVEPIFCVAYKRRYLHGSTWKYQYVIDPTARRIIQETGCDPSNVEDAYMLSYDVERRIIFQEWVQKYVDHGISSTINLPEPLIGDSARDFGNILSRHLRGLRGITVYPDGARNGQPLTSIPYKTAVSQEGVVFEETDERCVGGVCGA